MDRTAEVLQAPGLAVCMICLQNMGGVEVVSHSTVVQHYITSLHACTIFTALQWLIEAFKFKTTLTVAKDLTGYPAASIAADLLSGHGYVVHHVVDGAKEWGHLTRGRVMNILIDYASVFVYHLTTFSLL